MRKRMIPLLLAACLMLTACGTKKAETPEFDFQAETASLSELMAEANEARREAVDAPVNEEAIRPYVVEDTEAGGLLTAAEIEELKRLNLQLEKDAQHYVQLWDESKKNYMDYKEETQAIVLQRDDLLNQIKQKEAETQQLQNEVNNAKQQAQSSMEEVVKEVEDKCKELENSFFDLQMENLQLKKELEKYKNING